MTERSLLLKCDFAEPYFIVGTDFPAARVFDTSSSALVAVVELPLRSRAVSLAALTLTSVALCRSDETMSRRGPVRHRAEALVDDGVSSFHAAVGLSNGTVLLHDIRRDAPLAHTQVSETQQPILSLRMCGGYVFCLAANHTMYAVRIHDAAAGPCLRVRVPPDASSIAVTAVTPAAGSGVTAPHQVWRVLVAGPTNALYEVRALAGGGGVDGAAADAPQVHATKLLAFPSQGTSAEFAWVSSDAAARGGGGGAVSDAPVSLPAITASAQDGAVRIWDMQYTPSTASLMAGVDGVAAASTAVVARCRRTLLCGQRILHVSVLAGAARRGQYVMATTLTGSVLLWSLGDALLPPVAEPVPLRPDVVLVSAAAAGRLLFAALRTTTGAAAGGSGGGAAAAATTAAAPDPLQGLDVTLLRGRFALPLFETINVGDAVAVAAAAPPTPARASAESTSARRTALATLALGVAGANSSAVAVVELALSTTSASVLADQRDADYLLQHTTDAATSALVVVDTVWASHQQQQQQIAAKARQVMTDAFRAPQLHHAKSIEDLPVKQFTLEQRLQQVARDEAQRRRRHAATATAAAAVGAEANNAGDHDEDDEHLAGGGGGGGGAKAGRSAVSHHALGLATVPLYQALHANDTSAVMDLLNMSARSTEGMRATVLSLQLPYCLQLLHVISDRLGMCSKAVEKVAPLPADASSAADVDNVSAEAQRGNAAGAPEAASAPRADGSATANGVGARSATLRGGMAAFPLRSSLLEWIDAIVHYRGSELLALQRDMDAQAATAPDGVAAASTTASPPRDYLAPILHHYERLSSQYDKLAVLYGRLSIFKSVRPSQTNEFVNIPRRSIASNVEMGRLTSGAGGNPPTSDTASKRRLHLAGRSGVVADDVLFPVMFKESRARSGHRVVRVRSKVEIDAKRRARHGTDAALQKRARAMARAQLRSAKPGRSSILDDDSETKRGGGGPDVMDQIMMAEMEGHGGELDLDALEAMDLADGTSSDGSVSSDEDAETDGTADSADADANARRRARQTPRKERTATEAMLADEGHGEESEDEDEALDSSEVEFSSGSDDAVNSDAADSGAEDSDEETDSDSNDEERESGDALASDESSDEDDEDGMDDAMQELLARHEDDDDRTERRKAKKVRTD
ncbi:hypothetical protein NESM_000355800 [Novymonas esmeraldas]|uniref:Uncharacterized protein n=1 Tax=Novymonas esmeraldas TaxID=1808958 RepID=A0AAW0EMK0_9TRYP